MMKPIWIVDDDQSIRFVLEKALMREQLPSRSFTNARDVLAALSDDEKGPQVLVSDIRMPGGSGLDLLDKVKAKFPHLPVIIMTAYSDHEQRPVASNRAGQGTPGGRARRRWRVVRQGSDQAFGLAIVGLWNRHLDIDQLLEVVARVVAAMSAGLGVVGARGCRP